jgi:hypothetical protein
MSQRRDDDELRTRLARLDPAGARPVEPATGSRAGSQMERAMQTLDPPPALDDQRRPRRRLVLAGAAAMAAAAAVIGGVLVAGGGDDPAAPPAADNPTTLALALPAADVNASCIAFDENALARLPVAFEARVVTVTEDGVLLEVDRWYKGGNADQVLLATPDDAVSAETGLDFVDGERYVVTATDGTVNGCGFTVPATKAMEDAFERAFGS